MTDSLSWSRVVGDWGGLSYLPLWYENLNGVSSFNDFAPFGGWTKPSIKRYKCDESLCGGILNFDFA